MLISSLQKALPFPKLTIRTKGERHTQKNWLAYWERFLDLFWRQWFSVFILCRWRKTWHWVISHMYSKCALCKQHKRLTGYIWWCALWSRFLIPGNRFSHQEIGSDELMSRNSWQTSLGTGAVNGACQLQKPTHNSCCGCGTGHWGNTGWDRRWPGESWVTLEAVHPTTMPALCQAPMPSTGKIHPRAVMLKTYSSDDANLQMTLSATSEQWDKINKAFGALYY